MSYASGKDGLRIYEVGPRWTSARSRHEVFAVRTNGVKATNIAEAPGSDEIAPAWSPDARQSSFASDRDGGDVFVLDIFRMQANGSGQGNFTETPGAVETFSARSPDGRRRDPFSGNEDIFGMRSDGSDQRKLSGTLAADDYAPSWQPDRDDP